VTYLAESFEYFLSRNVRRLTMTPVLTKCSGWLPEGIVELDQAFRRICKRSWQHHEETGDIPLLLFRPTNMKQNGLEDSKAPCGAFDHSSPAVDVDGQRYGCVALAASTHASESGLLQEFMVECREGGPGRYGDVGEHVLQVKPQPEVAKLLSRDGRYSSYGKCADCLYAARCIVCPLAIAFQDGSQDPKRVPDFICAFNATVQKYRQQFLGRANEWRTRLNLDLLRDQMRPWLERAERIDRS
jgi:hypothetical protein